MISDTGKRVTDVTEDECSRQSIADRIDRMTVQRSLLAGLCTSLDESG
jgi:hypothetical protein